jgi:intein/homing endonuclease
VATQKMANRVKLYQKSTTSKDDLFPKKKEISTFLIGNAYSKDPFISDESKLRDRLMQKVGPRPSILEVSNNWLERNIKLQLEARPFILTNGIVKLSNVHAESGTIDIAGKKGILTPRYCRDNGITYHNEIKADVTYYPNINPLQDKDVAVKTSGHLSTAKEAMKEEKTKKDVSLGSVPIMLRSKHCILSSLDEGQCLNLGECGNDPGGYYIINGGERSIITQESLRTGLFMLWNNEETGKVENRITCVVDHGTTVVTMVLGSKWDTLKIGTYHTGKNKHIPLYVAFGFLGYNEDNATNLIAHFIPKEYAFAVLMYLQSSIIRGRSVGNDIVGYLSRKLDKQKSTSQNIDKTSGAITAMMQQDLFSHIKTLNAKARALAFMTAQTVMNVMGKRGPDNRDSWGIKKLSAPGRVMEVKLNTIWTNVIKVTQLAAAKTTSSNGLATFISSFPDATVTTDFTKAFTTSWSTKAGQAAEAVTDSLKRDTPASTLSQFTRITAPTSRKGKKSSLREVQQSQLSFICLSGDSLVLMGDGYTSRRIDTLKNKDEVMTADPDSLELSSSGIKNYFSKMPKKMLEIRTISGRSLKCDPAHPFLVSKKGKKVWIKAKDLKEGNNLFIKHYTTTVSKKGGKALVLNKEDFDQKYADELEELGFFEPLSQGTMAILAKLAGAIWTDGNIYKGKNGRKGWDVSFCVGAEEDANEINADIKELGFEPNPPKYKEDHQNKAGRQIIHHTWKVRKGGAFAALMVALGIPVGNKTYCEKKMPKWIIKASPYVKKEFLSGFQGGDGGRIFIKLTAQSSTVQMNMTQQVSCVDTSDSGIKFMEKMVKMYKDFGIDSAVKVSDTPEGKKVVALNILGSNENLNRYADMIEYRYCCEKRIARALPIEFLKYKLTRLQERRDAINKAIELDEEGELNKKQIAEEVGISYGMINKYIAKHKRKEEINITMPTGTINYPEFKERFFIEGKDLVIGEIESIKKIEVEEVYDFETISDNHDFFANGILVSNCSSESPEGEGSMAATAMMLMEDGSHMSIRDIVKGMGVRCMTFNKAEGKLDTTYVDKRWCFKTDGVNRTLYRITSITGQSVEATDDHPFFSQHGWTETRHLDIKEHKLALVTWQEDVSKEVEADIIMDSDLFKNSLHEQHIKNMIITKHCKKLNEILFPLYANDHRVPILARMYGYCVSNASITNNKSKSSMSLMLSFRTREDGINFIYDAEFLGFKSNPEIFLPKSPGAKHDFVKYSGILASLFVAFGFWGKNIPDWITEGSTTTKREFLAGLNSGKGECIKL